MSLASEFKIQEYEFDQELFDHFRQQHFVKNLWPVVYLLSDGEVREAYVGETADAIRRMEAHLKHGKKKKLTCVHLISSNKFNKSATLDIESNLIKYISGDGEYKLQNANIGLANHNYYQKSEVYWEIFTSIWDDLRSKGLAKHTIKYIDNSDLFKYSPYKTLMPEQKEGLRIIIENLLGEKHDQVIVQGGAGTGKTILAIFLFKMIHSELEDFNFGEFGEDEEDFIRLVKELKKKYPNPKMGLVVPMSSFRNTLGKVFKNVKGLRVNMVIGPAEVTRNEYDLLLVDESHRLRRRVNLGSYFRAFDNGCKRLELNPETSNELEWVLKQSEKSILFYDTDQSIKPSDVPQSHFDDLKSSSKSVIIPLRSQLRAKGGKPYEEFIDGLLKNTLDKKQAPFESDHYDLLLFDSIDQMVNEIKERDKEVGLSRLAAGFAWPWISKNDDTLKDIEIKGTELRWNSKNQDWINSTNALEEVGCIHTTQGYDLNYTGLIFGHEITYNKEAERIEVIPENYHDKAGKQTVDDIADLKTFITNIYKTLMLRGIKGTYVYACDPDLRDYLATYIQIAEQPQQEETTIVKRISVEQLKPYENGIPLYSIQAAAGSFSEIQAVDDVDWIELPQDIRYNKDLFACRVIGESMSKIIPNGSICLFREYAGGSRNGRIVLAELTDKQDPDTGSAYTVKDYQSTKKRTEDGGWEHEMIQLHPRSFDPNYDTIILKGKDTELVKVVGVFEQVLGKELSDY